MPKKTTYLKDYMPCPFQIVSVALHFDIVHLNEIILSNDMQIKRLNAGRLELNGEELDLQAVYLNDRLLAPQDYILDEEGLYIENCPDQFKLKIVTILHPKKNTQLSGLYASRQMLCTQCEAEGFRRMTYFLDRPDVLSYYTTAITAPKDTFPLLLSNGNKLSTTDLADGRHHVIWQDPFLKPSYLFALVAGDLASIHDEFMTQSGKKVGIDIFVEHGDAHLCDYAMQAVKHAMRWDEERFGREYDLERFMIVAAKDFNMGAMENKGLNIFNAKYVLADNNSATDEDILAIESVIGHEYFHNWTGNRVTCRDWFQLSLKEGLTIYRDQEFSSDMNGAVSQRIMDVANLRRVQFPEDKGALAHPVQPKSYQEIDNFYTATVYEKGAEIVRMYEVILGREGFRQGMDLYFSRHDGQAVRIEDFLAAMSDANQVNLSQFRNWYDQAGTPIVHVTHRIEGLELIIEMSQSCQETADGSLKKDLMIPIRFSVFNHEGARLADLPNVLILKHAHQIWRFPMSRPDVLVNFLQGFSAPIILKRLLSVEDIAHLMAVETDGFALWDLKQKLLIEMVQRSYRLGEPAPLNAHVKTVLLSWLSNPSFSHELLAELFSMPALEECLIGLEQVDMVRLEKIRSALRKELANALFSQFELAYAALKSNQIHETIGSRRWRNLCLQILMIAREEEYTPVIWENFINASNMTDRMAALRSLTLGELAIKRQEALLHFYQVYEHQELIMDKWFNVQALMPSENTLDLVKNLIGHPLFSWENPNKVRALIGGFIQNHISFHAINGSGYQFLVSCLRILDKINPQIAARMATPLTRWENFDNTHQDLIQNCLLELAKESLSSDLGEVVTKSLRKKNLK